MPINFSKPCVRIAALNLIGTVKKVHLPAISRHFLKSQVIILEKFLWIVALSFETLALPAYSPLA
jgi:hypothetical protein